MTGLMFLCGTGARAGRPHPGFAEQDRRPAVDPPAEPAVLLDEADAREEFTRVMTAVLDSPGNRDAREHGLPSDELSTAVATAVTVHRLGGIAAVGLLVRHEPSGVRDVVTIGSQTAPFHEPGALPRLDPGKPLLEHVPFWTDVYDKRGLLVFLAEPVFPTAG